MASALLVLVALVVLACAPAHPRADSAAARTPNQAASSEVVVAPASPTVTAVGRKVDVSGAGRTSDVSSDGSPAAPSAAYTAAAPVAAEPVAAAPSRLESFSSCVRQGGEFRLVPEPAYQAKSARTLATKLGFYTQSQPPMQAFCEPELHPTLCAYADCALPHVAFTWKLSAPRDGYGALGLLIIEEPRGQARAYRVESIQLSEQEFPCNCMAGDEFARVTRPAPDVVIVAYHAQSRPGRMCSDAYSTSTWLLDETARPVASILTGVEDTDPNAIEVRRSADEVRVRVPRVCEASIAWSELREAASREAEQRSNKTKRTPPASGHSSRSPGR